jgi:hypothetical protein
MKKIEAILKTITPILVILLLGSTLFISSCKPDDPKPKTKTQLLTTGTWKLTVYTYTCPGMNPSDLMAQIGCTSDNLHAFQADKKYTIGEGSTPCPGTDGSLGDNGVWTFVDSETKVRFEFPYISTGETMEDFVIDELSATTLKLTYPKYDGDASCVANLTFTKQ